MNNQEHGAALAQDRLGRLIETAKAGSDEALGELASECREYLSWLARNKLPRRLHAKVGASDIVQETLLKTCRHIHRFPGTTRKDLIRWLRRILLNSLIDAVRRHQLTGEVPLGEWTAEQFTARGHAPTDVAANQRSPGSQASLREETTRLQGALDLLPDDYRRVVIWRNRDRLSFAEIGRRIGRSAEAARKLWARAILRLQAQFECYKEVSHDGRRP